MTIDWAAARDAYRRDGSYIPIDGDDVVVAWITFDPLSREDSLEPVPGSHLGTVFNTSKFDPKDPTIPHDESLSYSRLPNIEADRASWDIVSWPVEPVDPAIATGEESQAR